MRIYIIGNDGITLCREAPGTVNEGEIAVASKEELHAARLSGKRLLALWNALPGVDKRRKIGDREALIDQLWSAIEALPDPDRRSDTKGASKQAAGHSQLKQGWYSPAVGGAAVRCSVKAATSAADPSGKKGTRHVTQPKHLPLPRRRNRSGIPHGFRDCASSR